MAKKRLCSHVLREGRFLFFSGLLGIAGQLTEKGGQTSSQNLAFDTYVLAISKRASLLGFGGTTSINFFLSKSDDIYSLLNNRQKYSP